MQSIISDLKARQDPRSTLMLDILRALVAFGGSLWLSELPDAVNRLHLAEAEAPHREIKEFFDAVKELKSLKIIKVEEKVRASEKAGGSTDALITLTSDEVRLSLLSDDVLNKYYLSVGKLFEEKK